MKLRKKKEILKKSLGDLNSLFAIGVSVLLFVPINVMVFSFLFILILFLIGFKLISFNIKFKEYIMDSEDLGNIHEKEKILTKCTEEIKELKVDTLNVVENTEVVEALNSLNKEEIKGNENIEYKNEINQENTEGSNNGLEAVAETIKEEHKKYIRKLPKGRKASEKARKLALEFGYELKDGETFVVPKKKK